MSLFCDPKQSTEACLEAHRAAQAQSFDAAWGSTDAIIHTVTQGPMAWLFLACLLCSLCLMFLSWKTRKEEPKKPITNLVCALIVLFFPVFSSISAIMY